MSICSWGPRFGLPFHVKPFPSTAAFIEGFSEETEEDAINLIKSADFLARAEDGVPWSVLGSDSRGELGITGP